MKMTPGWLGMSLVALLVWMTSVGRAANTWDGGAATDSKWNTADNWDDNTVPSFPAGIYFGGTNRLDADNDLTGKTATFISFNADAGAFALTGNDITIGGGITNNSASLQTIHMNMALGANTTVATASGHIALGGVISGAYTLTKSLNNILTLSGDNTFGGEFLGIAGTTVIASLKNRGESSAIGTNGAFRLGNSNNTGTLEYTGAGDTTDRQLKIGNQSSVAGTGGATILNNGSGALRFTNATLMLTNANIVSARVLTLGGANTDDNEIAGKIIDNSSVGGVLAVVKSGAGKWILSGANTYGGGTSLTGGSLLLGHVNALGTGAFTNNIINGKLGAAVDLSGGAGVANDIVVNQHLFVETDNDLKLSGNVTGNSKIMVKTGTGTLTFTGNVGGNLNTYRTEKGSTVIASGAVFTTTNQFNVGTIAGQHGYTTIQAGATVNAQLYMLGFGAETAGTVDHLGGVVTANGNTRVGAGSNAYGRYNLADGSLSAGDLYLGYANTSTGEFSMAGGQLNVSGKLVIGRDGNYTNSIGRYVQTGGTATIGTLTIAGNGAPSDHNIGYLIVSNGVLTVTNFSTLANGTFSTGILHFAEGSWVTLPALPTTRQTGSYAELTFDGGTLSNTVASTVYMQGLDHAYITTRGATFAVGADITVAQNLENADGHVGRLTKTGGSVLTLNGQNTYSGVTTISSGTLALGATGSIDNSTSIVVDAGATLDLSAKGMGGYALADGQTLTGSGTVNGGLIVGDGAILAPGNSPGTLEVENLTWNGGGILDWEVATNSVAGVAGTDWDFLNVTGSFIHQATAGDKFTINIKSWNGFASDIDETWTILTANDVSGFSADAFLLNDQTGSGGTWSITADAQNLYLTHAIPEPAVISLMALAGATLLVRRRMKNRG